MFRLATGLGLGLWAGLRVGRGAAPGIGLAGGFAVALAIGLKQVWNTPLATVQTANPLEVYQADRRRTLAFGLALGLAAGLTLGLAAGLWVGLPAALPVGLASGLVIGLAFGSGPALQLAVVEAIWGLRGKRVRFMPLLQTALHNQVLRQAGAVYQFRHAALQDLLATRDIATPVMEKLVTESQAPGAAL